ncbi:MAG TPA: penicillin-binding transpeptidase domain-containing protein [Actinomycetota bacterium]|nr:penicillin-binding transpeptidase domain-containing protein [Actinomycetota bacterium]
MRHHRLRAAPALLLLALAVACTEEVEVPSPRTVASDFGADWSGRRANEMIEVFDDTSASDWTPASLQKWLDRTLEDGAVQSFDVEVESVSTPEVESEEELDGLETTVPYTVSYTSTAATDPVVLEGELQLTYEDPGGWKVAWTEVNMWPDIVGAAGFVVDVQKPKRGAILDRNGKAIAKGPAAGRHYPFGSVGGSTVGHIEPVTKKEAIEGQKAGDLVGASGLEQGLEELLTASSGGDLLVVDASGEELEKVGGRPAGKPKSVKVTLDMEIQRAAENAYGGTTGGAVVIEPRTGDLLAVVSSSPFDPNNYVGVPDIDPFNRALSGTYPPGSAMKVVTASAALDTGTVKPNTTVTGPGEYKGVRNFESGEFGSIPFSVATQNSVNTAFAQVAEKLGAKTMTEYAEAFGFNQEPTMPLDAATPSYPFPENLTDLMWSSIGQAQVLASPLQMATVAATVANDGKRMEPRILLGDKPTGERAMSPKAANTMTDLMELVVTGGTGTAANLGSPTVAGKTGTAEVSIGGKIENHAWFVCFVPSDNPKIAVAVVSELGGVGGQVAAPLARQILQAVLPLT